MRVDWEETRQLMEELKFDREEIEEFENEFNESPVRATLELLDKKERAGLSLYSKHLSIDVKAESLFKSE